MDIYFTTFLQVTTWIISKFGILEPDILQGRITGT